MPGFEAILSVALAGLALSLSPGPSMLYVLSRSVGQSRRAGFASAIGLALGGIALAIATAFGLAMIFHRYGWLVPAMQLLGAGYLSWLGGTLIREAWQSGAMRADLDAVGAQPLSSIIWQGFWIELLNPKTVLFFALFLPPFIDIGSGPEGVWSLQMQLLVLGMLVPLTAVPSDLAVAWMGGAAVKLFAQGSDMRRRLSILGGLVVLSIGLGLLYSTVTGLAT